MIGNFDPSVDFTLLPGDDGQPFHVTRYDPGGATAWGITRATLSRWLGRVALVEDVQALTKDGVRPIYEAYFWKTIAGDDLPSGIDLMVFDHGVLSGEHQSACDLQRALGFVDRDVDGAIGPITLEAAAKAAPYRLLDRLRYEQAQHYRNCANFNIFGRGWLERIERRATAALNLVHA